MPTKKKKNNPPVFTNLIRFEFFFVYFPSSIFRRWNWHCSLLQLPVLQLALLKKVHAKSDKPRNLDDSYRCQLHRNALTVSVRFQIISPNSMNRETKCSVFEWMRLNQCSELEKNKLLDDCMMCVWEGENNDWEYQSISHIFGMIFGGQYTVIWLIQHILSSRAISKMTLLLPIDNVDRNWMISLLV